MHGETVGKKRVLAFLEHWLMAGRDKWRPTFIITFSYNCKLIANWAFEDDLEQCIWKNNLLATDCGSRTRDRILIKSRKKFKIFSCHWKTPG